MRNLKRETTMPPYMMFPRFLLQYRLSGTALGLYTLLLDRARLSMSKEDWIDENGDVFLIYTIEELSGKLSKSLRTITTALHELESVDLIRRKRQSMIKPSQIYVRIPDEADCTSGRKLPVTLEETCRCDTQKTAGHTGRKLPLSKNYLERTTNSNEVSKKERTAFGEYANVFLNEAEYERLQRAFPNLPGMISRMSKYLKSTGKSYQDYEAALRSWAAREPDAYIMTNYECREDESF